jgi:hypothetical protein
MVDELLSLSGSTKGNSETLVENQEVKYQVG